MASSSEELGAQAQALRDLVSRFQIDNDSNGPGSSATGPQEEEQREEVALA